MSGWITVMVVALMVLAFIGLVVWVLVRLGIYLKRATPSRQPQILPPVTPPVGGPEVRPSLTGGVTDSWPVLPEPAVTEVQPVRRPSAGNRPA